MKLHKEKQSWYLHFEEQTTTDHGPLDKGKQVVWKSQDLNEYAGGTEVMAHSKAGLGEQTYTEKTRAKK